MSSGPAHDDPEPFRHVSYRPGGGAPGTPETDDTAWFAVVLRGYDRSQVEARLAEMDRRIHEEIRRAEAAESSLTAARAHVRRLQEQLETRTPAPTSTTGDGDFGRRLARVLQAAEQEATELREKARADAEAIRAEARAEAEEHRNRTEEALLSRAAVLDREFAARGDQLDERERSATERLESARTEATDLCDRARAELERARAEVDRAQEESEQIRQDAERAVDDRRAEIARDVDRLASLRDEVHAELARVRDQLTDELDREPVAAVLDEDLFGPYGTDDDRSPAGTVTGGPFGARPRPLGDETAPEDEASAPDDEEGGFSGELVLDPDDDADDDPDDAADRAPDTADEQDDDQAGGDATTGTLLLGPGRRPERPTAPDVDESTIGQIPPISLASIGVLPFGEITAGGDSARTRTDGTNGASRGHRGPTRGPGPGRRSR